MKIPVHLGKRTLGKALDAARQMSFYFYLCVFLLLFSELSTAAVVPVFCLRLPTVPFPVRRVPFFCAYTRSFLARPSPSFGIIFSDVRIFLLF